MSPIHHSSKLTALKKFEHIFFDNAFLLFFRRLINTMEDADDIINFDQCPLEKVVVYMNGYAEIQRKATATLKFQQPSASKRASSPLPRTQPANSNVSYGSANLSSPNINRRSASPTPSQRTMTGMSTRRHYVVLRGLPGASLDPDSLRVEMTDYKGTVPVALDDVQILQMSQPKDGSKIEPALTALLEQQSLRDQITHVRRRYEVTLARKHRLLAQRTILDRVADNMSRGSCSSYASVGPDVYGNASGYGEPAQQQQQHQQQDRALSMINVNDPKASNFMATPNFVDALQSFLGLYDDRTHRVDNNLADTNAELERLEDQLTHLHSLASDADLRAPSPNVLLLTLSHFVNNSAVEVETGRMSPTGLTNPSAKVELSISYTVCGAYWQPSYELRLRPDDYAVQLVYSVAITQETGEDWLFERDNEDEETSSARLLVTTSNAILSQAAPLPPSADKIVVRTQSVRSTNSSHRNTSKGSNNNLAVPVEQRQRSSRNSVCSTIDESQQMNQQQRSSSPIPSGYATMRPYNSTNPSKLMHNDNVDSNFGHRFRNGTPIKHASSFAMIQPPQYEPDSDQEVQDMNISSTDFVVPSGVVFEADVMSAVSACLPSNDKVVQYALSTGAVVKLALGKNDNSKQVSNKSVLVKVPTMKQHAATPVKFVVGCHDLEVITLRYEATPRMASSAFAEAHLKNTSPLPLLAGNVAVFHDRASGSALFAYRTELPYVSVGDDFVVALGPDPSVAIEYQAPQRRTLKGHMSGKVDENLVGGESLQMSSSKMPNASSRDRSRSRDVSHVSKSESKMASAMAKWTYYRQLIGVTNRHSKAVVKVHVVEPLPKPADDHLRLILEAPVLQSVDKQVENGKTVRSSRKAKFHKSKDDFAARLNSSHQLEWDVVLKAGETRYLEIRYRLELKPGAFFSHNTSSKKKEKTARSASKPPTNTHQQTAMNYSTASLPRPNSAQGYSNYQRPSTPENGGQNVVYASSTLGRQPAMGLGGKPPNSPRVPKGYEVQISNAKTMSLFSTNQQLNQQMEQRLYAVRY